MLTAAGLSSILFSNKVTLDDFTRLVRAFAMGGSKAQDFAKQIKDTLGDNKNSSIRINEVKFVAADPATGEISMAAQLAAQALGPKPKQWLNDPQKLSAVDRRRPGSERRRFRRTRRRAPRQRSQRPHSRRHGPGRSEHRSGTQSGATWSGGIVPLQEEEVIQTIRLLTHFGQSMQDPNSSPENIQAELGKAPEAAKVNLAQLLESLAAKASVNNDPKATTLRF